MTVLRADESAPTAGTSTLASWRLALFARMWAVAALFHLLGNARDAFSSAPGLAAASALLAVAAVAALLAPYRLWSLALLCGAVPITAWYEAPVVGNHWVLASLISLAFLASTLVSRSRGDSDQAWNAFAPTARMTLLVAYGFAAFAKLNSGFLDPAVSCAVLYHNQLVGSWGLDALAVSGSSLVSHALPIGAAATELAVAATIALRRTRRFGLVLAAGFHWLLAMDLDQHFWDFSAVLFALFVVFLDDPQAARLRGWVVNSVQRNPVRPTLGRLVVVMTGTAVVALNVLPVPADAEALRLVLGHLAWWCFGTAVAVVLAVLAWCPREERASTGTSLRPPVAFLYALPALALLNGLTPYLEIKTGFGWNMYSNLRTVAGDSNHLLVPRTVDVTGVQVDQVRILRSSDPALHRLAGSQYVLPYKEFQKYAQIHPEVSVTYERDGRVHVVQRLAHDPAARADSSVLAERLQPFRLIDVSGRERCRSAFELTR